MERGEIARPSAVLMNDDVYPVAGDHASKYSS